VFRIDQGWSLILIPIKQQQLKRRRGKKDKKNKEDKGRNKKN